MKLALLFAAVAAMNSAAPSSAQEECCSTDADCVDLQSPEQAVSGVDWEYYSKANMVDAPSSAAQNAAHVQQQQHRSKLMAVLHCVLNSPRLSVRSGTRRQEKSCLSLHCGSEQSQWMLQ